MIEVGVGLVELRLRQGALREERSHAIGRLARQVFAGGGCAHLVGCGRDVFLARAGFEEREVGLRGCLVFLARLDRQPLQGVVQLREDLPALHEVAAAHGDARDAPRYLEREHPVVVLDDPLVPGGQRRGAAASRSHGRGCGASEKGPGAGIPDHDV